MSSVLRFGERQLKPYAEPVSARELREGEVYFFVNYIDDNMLIPTMTTVVFIGRDLAPGDMGIVYFQDVRSYRQGTTYDGNCDEEPEATFFHGSENDTGHIFEYERALDGLLACLLRRKTSRAE
jgi:hypothetical protein